MKKNSCRPEKGVADYSIVRLVRSGFKTSSFLAKNKNGEKILLTYLNGEKFPDRIEREEKILKDAALRVKNFGDAHVAETFGVGFDKVKNQLVIVSEYVPGVDFFHATRGLSPVQMISLFVQALEGLSFIHKRGFLHLNIKPQRIRVDMDGVPMLVKFTDFGFAIPKTGYDGDYTGTAIYMAPEVVSSCREKIDERADLYSFGVLAYQCLTERIPTQHRLEAGRDRAKICELVEREAVFSPPSHFNKKIPPPLDKIVMNLLEKEPTSRPRTADALINEFVSNWPAESREMPHEQTSTLFE